MAGGGTFQSAREISFALHQKALRSKCMNAFPPRGHNPEKSESCVENLLEMQEAVDELKRRKREPNIVQKLREAVEQQGS